MNRNRSQLKIFSLLGASLALLLAFLTQTGCTTERAKRAHLERGESYLAERKFQEAALEFRSVIELDKTAAAGHYGLARAYEGQMRLAEAIEELQRAVDADKTHLDARLKLGNYYLLIQPPRIADAEKTLNEIFAIDRNNIEGRVLQASLFTLQNKPEKEILAVLEEAIALDPNRVETYLSLARFYLAREKTAEAEKTFRRALEINGNSATAHIELARFLDSTNRADEAEKHYRRATEIDPRNREALEAFANFYVAHGRLDRAEAIYGQIADLNPNKPEERIVLADFYAAVNRDDDAIRVYQEILRQKPEFVRARARLGEIYLQRGDRDNLNAQIAEILSRNGRDVQGLLLRGRIRLRDGEPEAAIKDLQEVLKQEPSSRLALYYMADAQLRAGQIEQARNFNGDLQRFHPGYLYGKMLALQINLAGGDAQTTLGQANDLLARLERAAPDRDTSRAALGEIRVNALLARSAANSQLNRLNEARADLQAAQKLAPNAAGVYLGAANFAARTGARAEAAALYEKTLQTDPNNYNALGGLIAVRIAERNFGAAHERADKTVAGSSQPNLRAAAYYLKSQIFVAEGKTGDAENALEQATAASADYLPAYAAHASLLAEQNKIDEAIAKYRQVLQRNPNDAGTYTLIGLLEDGRGRFDSAIENYRKALQLNPNSPIAANNLAWLYAEQNKGDLDEATALAQTLTEKYPQEAGYADTLGWILHKKGFNDLALVQLRKAVALDEKAAAQANQPANPVYRARLGTVLAAAGDRAAARRELETALKNPAALSAPEREQAQNALRTLEGNS